MLKRALVLGGGGSKGSYQVGVWQALRELGVDLHIVTGTSIGALNGALIAQNQYDVCVNLWSDMKFEMMVSSISDENFTSFKNIGGTIKMFFSEFISAGGLDISALEDTIRTFLDEDVLRSSPIDFGLITVELPGMREIALSKSEIPEGKIADYLVASAACFPAFKVKDIDNAKYIDGGYRNNLPMDLAVDLGANEIIAVDLEGFVFNNIPKVENVPIRYIKCHWDLGLFLQVDHQVISRNIKLGYLDTMRSYGVYEGNIYCFNLGEKAKLYDKAKPYLKFIADALGIDVTANPVSPADKLVRHRLISALNRRRGARVNLEEYALKSAEIAGELMLVDPTNAYSLEEFNEQIIKAFDADINLSVTNIEKALESPKNMVETATLLGRFERREITAYIYKTIEQAVKSGSGAIKLKALAAVASKEFSGTMYIYAIKNPL